MTTSSIKRYDITNPKIAKIFDDIGNAIDEYNDRLDEILTVSRNIADDKTENEIDRWLAGCIASEIIEHFVLRRKPKLNRLYRNAIIEGEEDYHIYKELYEKND